MTDRTELLESALDSRPDGIALLGTEGELMFWNRAATATLGYSSAEVTMQAIPKGLEALLDVARRGECRSSAEPEAGRGAPIHVRHKLGPEVPVMARVVDLYDGAGVRIGTAVVFHPAESLDALPHGETGDNAAVEASQADLEERLQTEYEDFTRGGPPFGVLWVTVDQAQGLRKTHGANACEAMLEKVQRALLQGLRAAEEEGRWGDDEFLILSHERTPEMLAAHAQALAGLARTADFRWWGDRVSLTVSIGAAQADSEANETLAQLLERARGAMEQSIHAGGNCITSAPRGASCLPS